MLRTDAPTLSLLSIIVTITSIGTIAASADQNAPSTTEVQRIKSPDQSGQAYRLIYTVNAPLDAFWKFKTSFGAKFLVTNRYILSNRLVERKNNVFITETRYTDAPKTVFRWQTTVYPSAFRMNYVLLNPEECGQKYNRGTIQLADESGQTRVVHSTYFDFFGATVWVHFPGAGGMVAFLRYTADWERDTIRQIQHRYLP